MLWVSCLLWKPKLNILWGSGFRQRLEKKNTVKWTLSLIIWSQMNWSSHVLKTTYTNLHKSKGHSIYFFFFSLLACNTLSPQFWKFEILRCTSVLRNQDSWTLFQDITIVRFNPNFAKTCQTLHHSAHPYNMSAANINIVECWTFIFRAACKLKLGDNAGAVDDCNEVQHWDSLQLLIKLQK